MNNFLALLPLGLFLARVRSATMANLTLAVLKGQFSLTVSIEYGHRGLPRHASTLVWVGIAVAPVVFIILPWVLFSVLLEAVAILRNVITCAFT